jgi:hypothetical protein
MRWIAASVTWRNYHAAVERRVMILWRSACRMTLVWLLSCRDACLGQEESASKRLDD